MNQRLYRLQHVAKNNVHLLAGLAVGCVLTLGVALGYHPDAPTPMQLEAQRAMLAQARARVISVKDQPLYRPIASSWEQAVTRFETCGLTVSSDADASAEGFYSGPATAWHGRAMGPAPSLIACLATIPEPVALQPAAFRLSTEGMALWFSVIGRPSIGITQ